MQSECEKRAAQVAMKEAKLRRRGDEREKRVTLSLF